MQEEKQQEQPKEQIKTSQVVSGDLLKVTLSFSRQWVDEEAKQDDIIFLVRHGLITKLNQKILSEGNDETDYRKMACQTDKEGVPALQYAVFYNYQNLVMYLLCKGADPFSISKNDERTVFHIACYMGHIQSIQIILNYRRHIKRYQLYNNIKGEMKKYNVKKSDVKQGILVSPDRHIKQVKDRFIQFQNAVNELTKKTFNELIEDFRKIMEKLDQYNRNILHYTSMNKTARSVIAANLFLSYDLKLEGFDEFLQLFQEVQLLDVTSDAKIDPRQYLHAFEYLENLILPSTYQDEYKKFKQRVREIKQKSVVEQDQDGYTPLHLAAFNGSFSGIQLLLKHCQSKQQALEIKDVKNKRTVLDYAENDQVRKYLVDLQDAARKGDQESMKLLVNCGHDINQRKTIFGVAPIHNSLNQIDKQNPIILDFIINCDANIDVTDSNGWTGVHHACKNGDINSLSVLLKQGASLSKASNKGYFPLHIAAIYDQHLVIQFLLKGGQQQQAQTEVIDNDKCTPLILAAKKGFTKSIKVLLDYGANLYAQDVYGWTGLHHAAFNYHSDAIKQLCEYDADDEKLRYIVNKKGQAAKQLANKPGKSDVLFNMNTIWNAAREANLDVLRKLHQKGEKLDKQTIKYGYTPLHLAVMGNTPDHYLIVKYLVDNGANPNLDAKRELGILSQEDRDNYKEGGVESWRSPIGYAFELQNGKIQRLLEPSK